MTFGESFTNFNQRSIWDGISTPMNSKFKLLGEFARGFVVMVDGLRNNNSSSSNRGISSSVGNNFLPNFGGSI
jgi:hypothetical protein